MLSRNVGAVWKKFCILLCKESQQNINSCFWDLRDKEAQLLLSSAMFQRHMKSTRQLVYWDFLRLSELFDFSCRFVASVTQLS